ncbi:hypothetical protein PROFUN_16768 [Planoprotostelium fungivorum]|uniref:F-box domain-containing protein n=1 Tax=Planoprotostelium fungivorum TaxID=1890364 RepID=A0A2P6MNT7_9EUKA|nr:hypothetical protein PROFUN_16768 [Planoprotostelium fungivorum]
MSLPVDARNEVYKDTAHIRTEDLKEYKAAIWSSVYLCAAEVSGNPDALAKKGVGDERRTFEQGLYLSYSRLASASVMESVVAECPHEDLMAEAEKEGIYCSVKVIELPPPLLLVSLTSATGATMVKASPSPWTNGIREMTEQQCSQRLICIKRVQSAQTLTNVLLRINKQNTGDGPMGELMQWHDLPEEVIHLILVHLRGGDRLSSMLVCKRWHEACLLLFDPTEEDCRAVRWACMNNRPICADYLMRDHRVDELKIYNDLLLLSVQFDHVEIIDLLLLPGRADPSMCWNCPLEKAAELGHGSVVERLLIDPRVEPTDAALWTACLNNRPEVIEILLADARVDPSESNNLALRIAEENDFFQVADVLLRDYRVTERVLNPL